tara:strand:+ start:3338 stop:3979 length:642 start_codon:yes stop_codon:yes gene_type:complete
MEYFFPIIIGSLAGYFIKCIINWIDIDNYKINKNNFILEIICPIPWIWSFLNLPLFDAVIFSCVTVILIGISFVDFYTMQIPLIFVIIGAAAVSIAIFKKSIYLSSAVYGIFVGAIIPLIILGLMWLITKRQGMGFGDIQIGFVLGAWLGPMRMALALFFASVLSLIVWIAVSIVRGFDKDRAIPMGPFLSVAGTGVYVGSFYYPELFYLLII